MSLDVAVRRAWKGFSLDVEFVSDGSTLGILGASGCGKSMTLKSIAGIETPQTGKISVGEQVLFDSAQGINLRPQQRNIGYLFQSYALFPHMSVEENIACALSGIAKSERRKKAMDLIERFRLEGLGGRFPGQLSGGQQQRVALARILAYEPQALLLDEPFSALDYHLKEQLQLELINLLRGYGGDVVIVTHSRDEVYHLCERLMVMENGRCIATGKTKELFRHPGLVSVAKLTGCKNYSVAVPLGKNRVLAKDWGVELDVADEITADITHIGVRAHDFTPVQAGAPNAFAVTLQEQLESPFEWNILFVPETARCPVWWKVPKDVYGGVPGYLSVAPESILPLTTE